MRVAGERGQGGLDQGLGARKGGNLVRRHRVAVLKGVQLLLCEHCLSLIEVQAVVLKLLWFSAFLAHQQDAISELAVRVREGNHLWQVEGKLAASNCSAVAVPVDQL